MKFKSCTALVTPFDEKQNVDYDALTILLEHQIANHIDAILVLGTTGEASTISYTEREKIIKHCVKVINKRCLLLIGTGSNSTRLAVKFTKQAKVLGADGCVVVTPYYNKCTQNGLISHYKAIDKVGLPFIVYNVPSRTGLNISPATFFNLEKLENMRGLKEANGDVNHILEILKIHTKPVYSGNDKLNHVFISHGADGCISVLSNVFPKAIVDQCSSIKKSLKIHNAFYQLNNLLFCEVNPIPTKFVLSKFNMCKNVLRLPLTPLEKANEQKILTELKKHYLNIKTNMKPQ